MEAARLDEWNGHSEPHAVAVMGLVSVGLVANPAPRRLKQVDIGRIGMVEARLLVAVACQEAVDAAVGRYVLLEHCHVQASVVSHVVAKTRTVVFGALAVLLVLVLLGRIGVEGPPGFVVAVGVVIGLRVTDFN